MGNKSQNLPYCSLLQSLVVYNFTEIESTFPVPFWDYVADCLWLRDMVSIYLIRKGKYDHGQKKRNVFPFLMTMIGLIARQGTSPWLAQFSSISAAIYLLLKIFCEENKFFILKFVSSFPTSCLSWSISELLLL